MALAHAANVLNFYGVYREQDFVERCACNEPAVAGCASCGRARCGFHLVRGLCLRCTEAIRRELEASSGARFTVSAVSGAGIVFGLAALHITAGILLGVPFTIAMLFALHRLHRRRLIRLMGPSLAASKGELPPPSREPDDTFVGSDNGVPPGWDGHLH